MSDQDSASAGRKAEETRPEPEKARPGAEEATPGAEPETGETEAGTTEAGSTGRQDGGGPGRWELPWAEPFGTGAPERARLATEFGAAVRKTGSLMNLVGQAAADRIGINATDLNCLNIVSFSGELTAGELARATGLTTASITGVVDRLEKAGFVRRVRDTKDRRRVVVHLELEKALSEVATVFVPMMRDWQQLAGDYTDDELRLIVRFYSQMEQVFRDHIVRLREPGRAPGSPAS